MPWKRKGRTYTTPRGGGVKRPRQYEALRRRNVSKSRAAAIANAPKKGTKEYKRRQQRRRK